MVKSEDDELAKLYCTLIRSGKNPTQNVLNLNYSILCCQLKNLSSHYVI